MIRSFKAVWQLEWRRTFARRRLFRLNIIIPLLLVTPIAFAGAPPAHGAAVYAVLFALFGTFGAAIPALRDGESGLARRLDLLPLDARGVVLARALAGGCIDTLQLLPALIVILLAGDPSPAGAALLLIVLAVSLVFANLIGLVVAAAARSVGEGALFAAVIALLLLHASGVFRTPAGGSLGARIELIAPYRALHELLLQLGVGGSAQIAGLWPAVAVVVLLTALFASPVLHALARTDGNA